MNACPESDQLRHLLDDQLAGPEAEGVEAHVEECISCQQELERLTDDAAQKTQSSGSGEDGVEFLRRLEERPPGHDLQSMSAGRSAAASGPQALLAGLVDDAHAASAEFFQYLVPCNGWQSIRA